MEHCVMMLLGKGDNGDDAVFQLQVIQMIIWSSEGCDKNGRIVYTHTNSVWGSQCAIDRLPS